MIVSELIERLQHLPQDLEVRISVDTEHLERGGVLVTRGPVECVFDVMPGALTGDVRHIEVAGRSHELIKALEVIR